MSVDKVRSEFVGRLNGIEYFLDNMTEEQINRYKTTREAKVKAEAYREVIKYIDEYVKRNERKEG